MFVHPYYTGKERDSESGLDYFGARYYGSSMGRFQSPDSLLGSPENPQSWNLYSYVQNNPLTNTDPDGHDCVVQTRTSDTTESVSVSSGTCDNVSVGDGQSKSYIAGTVDTSSIKGNSSGGISLNYTPYAGGADLGVSSLSAAPIPNSTNLAVGWGNNAQGYQTLSNANGVVQAAAAGQAAIYGGVVCYFACPAGAAVAGRWGLQRLALGASSPALLNLINRLYQAQDEIPGGTAGAVRNEVMTGEFINGGHSIKAQEMITALTKLINSGELSGGDQTIAGHIISDLKNSLGK
jgi:RHS repeat-associated protein